MKVYDYTIFYLEGNHTNWKTYHKGNWNDFDDDVMTYPNTWKESMKEDAIHHAKFFPRELDSVLQTVTELPMIELKVKKTQWKTINERTHA